MMNFNKSVGKSIREARKKKGLTRADLAKELHVTGQAVSHWENEDNRVDESIRGKLERFLGIRITYVDSLSGGVPMNIMPLEKIDNLDVLFNIVKTLVEQVDVDQNYATTIKTLLEKLLLLILGFDCYYHKKCYPEEVYDWHSIAENLESLVERNDNYPIPSHMDPPSAYESMLLRKIEFIHHQIGCELFEDFDDEGYRNGYIQQIGRVAEASGIDLVNILPDNDCSLLVSLKVAILHLSEVMYSLDKLHDGIVGRIESKWDEEASIFPDEQ